MTESKSYENMELHVLNIKKVSIFCLCSVDSVIGNYFISLGFFFICRDLVHRQTSMSAIQHIALGVYGFGCEDALTHLLNYVWPNIFETSPHVVQAFMGSIEGMRVGIGPSKILQYALQVRTIKTTLFGVGERIWGGWGLEFSLEWGDPCSHGHVHNHMIILHVVNCSHSVAIQIPSLDI